MKICIKKPVGLSVIRDVGSAQALNPVFQSLVPGSTRLDIYSFGPASLFLKEQGVHMLWMNARIGAIAFYEKLQFLSVGDLFDIPPIGMHQRMYKELQNE